MRFIGATEDVGGFAFRHGSVYAVRLDEFRDGMLWFEVIDALKRRKCIPYSSIDAFMRNWELASVHPNGFPPASRGNANKRS